MSPRRILPFLSALAVANAQAAPTPVLTPEEQILRISKHLKVIDDDQWKTIAGERASEKYAITRGDTLSDISKRLFGDARYWPKVWALNNENITNPHVIRPGNEIAFLSGSGSSLPGVSIESASDAPTESGMVSAPRKNGKDLRGEWAQLPAQRWEMTQAPLPTQVDALGFDTASKINFPTHSLMEITLIPSDQPIKGVGVVSGSDAANATLVAGATVIIDGSEATQIGELYSVVEASGDLTGPEFERSGIFYNSRGKVRILGTRDGKFIGRVEKSQNTFWRNATLIDEIKSVDAVTPIPAPEAIKAHLFIDHTQSSSMAVQHTQVIVNRGTDDGVKVGMVFRAFRKIDPHSGLVLLQSNVLGTADLQVIYTTPRFSVALILSSTEPVEEQTELTLLTDVSDLLKSHSHGARSLEGHQPGDDGDELDRLDQFDGLGKDEERELKQLEKWKANPEPGSELVPAPPSSDLPAPPTAAETPPPPVAPDPLAPPAPEPAPAAPQTLPAVDNELDSAPPPPPESTPTAPALPPVTGTLETPAAPPAPSSVAPPAASPPADFPPIPDLPPPPTQ